MMNAVSMTTLLPNAGMTPLAWKSPPSNAGTRRVQRAKATDITTLWTRAIEQVVVKISIHDGRKTIPVYMECDGEQAFVVNEMYVASGKRFKISHLKLRDGPLMRKEGWKTVAHRIKRIYGIRL